MDRAALYVLRRDLMKGFEQRANGAAACFVIDAHAVCVHRDTIAKWHGEFDVMFTVLPSLDELVAFFRMLDDEYRVRLLRAPHGRSVATEERLTRLARYLWSRLGGCGPHAASQRAMAEAPQEPMGCGLPPARPVLPSRAETAAFYERFESASLSRSNGPASTTHVDVEGEAVWMQQYVGERLAGRDAGAARAVVLDAIRAIAESRP